MLSPQQVVDCSGQLGCQGGSLKASFGYMTGGVCAEAAYPYTASVGACKAAACAKVATVKSATGVKANSQAALEAALRQQPVTVAVAASTSAWQLYSSGVLNDPTCGSALDHAVLLVGIDSAAVGGDFWRLRNQWGVGWVRGWERAALAPRERVRERASERASACRARLTQSPIPSLQGEAGHIRLARGASTGPSGQCGVLSDSVVPNV